MKRTVLSHFCLLLASIFFSLTASAQTTVSGVATGTSTAAATGVNVFGVTNSNTYGIAITTFSIYHGSSNNGRTYSVWYHPSAITGAPSVTAANGWVLLGTSATIGAPTNAYRDVLTNQFLVIPPNTTYRIAIVCNSGFAYFSTTGSSSYSAGNVSIQTGSSTVSPGYAGSMPNPNLSPRYFSGSVTFVQASADNIAVPALITPTNNTSYCSYDSSEVKVAIRNDGSNPQTNFPITARYTGTTTGTISTTYSGTLAAYAKDTVVIGKLNLSQGSYSIRAYAQVSGDTVHTNDTTGAATIIFRKPLTPPSVSSDTVCPGNAGSISINGISNTSYKWYASPGSTTLLNVGTSLNFVNVTQDTVMWVNSDSANCVSVRVPIGVYVVPPPSPYLGLDTSFCESIPLTLDAGHPGAGYIWSTGDTTQTIQVTNVSGKYWVEVNQYCAGSDTIDVTIRPMPYVTGISYVRSGNTYNFTASFSQYVESWTWYFGDGFTSNDSAAVHTYGSGISTALNVILVVSNTCGSDTVMRSVPTAIKDVDLADRISIFPNPASKMISIETGNLKVDELMIVNMTGSLVLRQTDISQRTVNLEQLVPGNYILRLKTNEGYISKPLQVQR